MRHTLLGCAIFLAQLASPLAASASPVDFCADPARRWCLGTLTFNSDLYRVENSVFSNGDLLVEVTERGRLERMFKRSAEQQGAYYGLTDDEQRRGGVGFKFSLEGAGIVLGALALAFPDGPASVPATATEKQVDAWGSPMRVIAWQSGDRIAFRLATRTDAPAAFSGEFSSVKPPSPAAAVIASWGPEMHVEPLARLSPPPLQQGH